MIVLTSLALVSLSLVPSVSADMYYGNAPCGYTTRYYSYSYPYVFTRMNKSFVRFVFYSYPTYYPTPAYQLTVASSPPGLPVSGSGQFCKNQMTTVSVASSIIYAGPGTRYIFTGWSGDYSGTSTTGQVAISGSMSVTANFKTQHLLTVNSPYGTTSGPGWYDADSSAYASLDKSIVDLAAGVRARFVGWSGDTTGQSIPTTVQMTGPKTVTAQWKNQYYVSVSSGIGEAKGSGWYDEGSQITIFVSNSFPAGYGSLYVFEKWVGSTELHANSAQITVDRPITIEATWRLDQTQLYQTIGVIAAGIVIAAATSALLVYRKRQNQVVSQGSSESHRTQRMESEAP